ncbi:hypothetical protein [Lysinibacillus sp. NPDC093692]|uniref:hypothetical protein n=1 Tax=Lysinibacillus sp. NPDC093692 TaxID=3390578 RepID=UPI003D012B4E
MICIDSIPKYEIKHFDKLEYEKYGEFLNCFLTDPMYILLFKEFEENLDSSWIEKMDWDLEIQENVKKEERNWERLVRNLKVFTTQKWLHPFYNETQNDLIFFSPMNQQELQQIIKKRGLINDSCIVIENGKPLEEWTYILTFVEHVFENEEDEYCAVIVLENCTNEFKKEVFPVLKAKFQLFAYEGD